MGAAATTELVVLGRNQRAALFPGAHHPGLGSGRAVPYSAVRGKKPVNRQALDELKRQIPLLDYLQAHQWRPARRLSRGRWMGLCPLHRDHHPSFLVDPNKGLFYCYGCGRGGDVIRFAEKWGIHLLGPDTTCCGLMSSFLRRAGCRVLDRPSQHFRAGGRTAVHVPVSAGG